MTSASPGLLKRFIVLEGGDGAGTTTQLRLLGEALARAAVPHWISSEPTDSPEGRLIRSILSGELTRDPGTLARLFAADRNEHLRGVGGILERLGKGEAVICDRYVLSSLAYQGVACGRELPAALNADFPLPELLLFFDLEPEASMERIRSRERFEIFEELPFQEKVRAAYRAELSNYSSSGMRVIVLDASGSVEDISRAILDAVGAVLGIRLTGPSRET
jgi:dTMP kinase